MNIYELLGRIGVLHLDCENLFSEIGQIVDDKRQATIYNADDFSDSQVTSIKSKLLSLRANIEEYISLFSDDSHEYEEDNSNTTYANDVVKCTNVYLSGLSRITRKYDINFYMNFLDVGNTGKVNLIMICIPPTKEEKDVFVVLYAEVDRNSIYIGRSDDGSNKTITKIYTTIRDELEKFNTREEVSIDLRCDKDTISEEDSKMVEGMLNSLYHIGDIYI